MGFNAARRSLLTLAAAGSALAIGCSSNTVFEETDTTRAAITDVDQSAVKRQSIGNCWLYAGASWAEALAKSAGAGELNMSESYWTYWHWFDQIVASSTITEVRTGGSYGTAVDIMSRYGIMPEAVFIPSEAEEERSLRQKSALAKINESLATGALSTPEARRDRALVRRELDLAFELAKEVVAELDLVFGPDVVRTLEVSTNDISATSIKRARDIPALLREPDTKQPYLGTLQDAIGTRTYWGSRTGRYAWRTAYYPSSPTGRRTLLARMQRAMHHALPVVVSWYVDFAARNESNQFLAPPVTPGPQGGHLVVAEDYQVTDVPGFGTLSAGVLETRPEALEAALSPSAKIEFIRIKNSWGTHRPDPLAIGPGYYDLYMPYLDGPIQQCTQENGASTDDCWPTTPLSYLVLPAGY
jgi:hypothetical protein